MTTCGLLQLDFPFMVHSFIHSCRRSWSTRFILRNNICPVYLYFQRHNINLNLVSTPITTFLSESFRTMLSNYGRGPSVSSAYLFILLRFVLLPAWYHVKRSIILRSTPNLCCGLPMVFNSKTFTLLFYDFRSVS